MYGLPKEEYVRLRIRGVHIPIADAVKWVRSRYRLTLGDIVNEALADWLIVNAPALRIPDYLMSAANLLPEQLDEGDSYDIEGFYNA